MKSNYLNSPDYNPWGVSYCSECVLHVVWFSFSGRGKHEITKAKLQHHNPLGLEMHFPYLQTYNITNTDTALKNVHLWSVTS